MTNPSRIFVCQADSVEFIDSEHPQMQQLGKVMRSLGLKIGPKKWRQASAWPSMFVRVTLMKIALRLDVNRSTKTNSGSFVETK
jgi:hypothetical protein